MATRCGPALDLRLYNQNNRRSVRRRAQEPPASGHGVISTGPHPATDARSRPPGFRTAGRAPTSTGVRVNFIGTAHRKDKFPNGDGAARNNRTPNSFSPTYLPFWAGLRKVTKTLMLKSNPRSADTCLVVSDHMTVSAVFQILGTADTVFDTRQSSLAVSDCFQAGPHVTSLRPHLEHRSFASTNIIIGLWPCLCSRSASAAASIFALCPHLQNTCRSNPCRT